MKGGGPKAIFRLNSWTGQEQGLPCVWLHFSPPLSFHAEQERMEREAGKLFYHLDRIFTRYRHGACHKQGLGVVLQEALAGVLLHGEPLVPKDDTDEPFQWLQHPLSCPFNPSW